MGIYPDNVLLIIVIAENSFDLSITDITFVIYFVIADKRFFIYAVGLLCS